MTTSCPATCCPLFAAAGSPWTGQRDAPCDQGPTCGFWQGECIGVAAAREQVDEAAGGRVPLQLRPAPRLEAGVREYDCPKAGECQWQAQSPGLCPPREALARGIDPRLCAW